MRKFAIVGLLALTLGGCAGWSAGIEVVKEKKITAYGQALDVVCGEVMVDTVVRAVMERPELLIALPLLCPETIGVLFALANQAQPDALNIQLMPAVQPATEGGATEWKPTMD